ncbi:MAG: hypothetical protein OHK0019_24960 [Saprospiraceae bacterium]
MFITKVFFEDTIGNRDSITIGFDTLANYEYNPQFGELNITAPFDSVFEIRAAHGIGFGWGEGNYVLSKTIIGGSEKVLNLDNCYVGETVILFIKAKHQPVKISWNKFEFNDTNCLSPTFLTPDRMFEMINPIDWFEMPNIRYSCASKNSEYYLLLDTESRAPNEVPYVAMKPVLGGDIDSIIGVAIHPVVDLYYSPCQFVSSNYEIVKKEKASVIYPNPTNTIVTIQNTSDIMTTDITISDQIGRVVFQSRTPLASEDILEINLEDIKAGIYFIHQKLGNGKVYLNKFVKI